MGFEQREEATPDQAARLRGEAKRSYVRSLFDDLAPRYDFLRLLVFAGQTSRWYRRALGDLGLRPGQKVLDVGCGTGESTRFLRHRYPGVQVEGMDLSAGMLEVARRRDGEGTYFEGDVGAIPRPGGQYDVLLTAFTFRNFPAHEAALREMLRVLAPGGRLVLLDHFPPQRPAWWRAAYLTWMRRFVPVLVRPFIADPTPYRYLAESIIHQLSVPEFEGLLARCGARLVQTSFYTGGAAGRLIAVRQGTQEAPDAQA